MECDWAGGRRTSVPSQAARAARASGWQKEAERVFIKRWGGKDTAVTAVRHMLPVNAVLTF